MQQGSTRRTNRERSDESKARLIAAARTLFIENGYAETSTPEIVAAAGLTRGALYHHFTDKQALFRAIVEQESATVAEEIEAGASNETPSAIDALMEGSRAYFDAMAKPGRAKLLLLEGPAVLGRKTMDEIDAEHGARTLLEGLTEALAETNRQGLPLGPLSEMLSAAFDRAALAISEGADSRPYQEGIEALLSGLIRQS